MQSKIGTVLAATTLMMALESNSTRILTFTTKSGSKNLFSSFKKEKKPKFDDQNQIQDLLKGNKPENIKVAGHFVGHEFKWTAFRRGTMKCLKMWMVTKIKVEGPRGENWTVFRAKIEIDRPVSNLKTS